MISDEVRSEVAKHIGQLLYYTSIEGIDEPTLPFKPDETRDTPLADPGVPALVWQFWRLSRIASLAKRVTRLLRCSPDESLGESPVEYAPARKPSLPLQISEMEEGAVAEAAVGSLVRQWWRVSDLGDVQPVEFEAPLSPYLYFLDADGVLIQEIHGQEFLRRACSLESFFDSRTLADVPVVWRTE